MRKILVIILKEWSEVFKNRMVLFSVAFLPLLFTALPLIIVYSMGSSSEDLSSIPVEEIGKNFNQLCAGLNGLECGQFFFLTQFLMLFMMMPVIIPVTIASYSIVGEKSTRTLEPLLATPISTFELLAGKALSAMLPALFASWIAFFIYTIGVYILSDSPKLVGKLFDPIWLIAIFIVGPLLTIASVCLAVMVSSRSNDPRVAEQVAGLLILPIAGLLVSQASGLIILNKTLIIWIGIGVLLLDIILITFAVNLFQRETILTRWK